MEKSVILSLVGLVLGFLIFKYLLESRIERDKGDSYSDVLTNKKYMVKGQWDR